MFVWLVQSFEYVVDIVSGIEGLGSVVFSIEVLKASTPAGRTSRSNELLFGFSIGILLVRAAT